MTNFGNPVCFELQKMRKNKILPHLLLLLIKNPSIPFISITLVAVHMDCFKYDGKETKTLVSGLPEELFFAVNPNDEESTFFYYELTRFLIEVTGEEDQLVLLELLRKEPLA